MGGTVNISRSIWQDAAFKSEPFTEREAFIWLIMDASYTCREKRVGNVTVTLRRGQLIASVRFMAEAWQWSKSRVDRFLWRLENRDMIGTDSGTGVNVITICKYDDYQGKPKGSGTANFKNRDSSGTAAGQQRDKPNLDSIQDATKEEKPEAKASVKKSRRKPLVELPEGWVPSEKNVEDAQARGFNQLEIDDEADRFRNYHYSKQSQYRDWNAAWRTWLGNARKFAGRSRGQARADAADREMSFAASFARTPRSDIF